MPPPPWLILAFLLLRGNPADVARPPCEDDDTGVDCSSEGSYNQDSNSDRDPNGDDKEGHFTYETSAHWRNDYPSCRGRRQSPINIEISNIRAFESDNPPLRGLGYEIKPEKMFMLNSGHTVILYGEWVPNLTPMVWGGPLLGAYRFEQMHFHWSIDNKLGSEHTIGNQSYPLEMHYVHYKTAYENITNALNYDDGVLVLAYLFSFDGDSNLGIEMIQSNFLDISFPNEKKKVEPFPLNVFGVNFVHEGFLTYSGSLTTPPCTESVVWLLSVKIKSVSEDQMEKFREIILTDNEDHNYRETQSLHGRKIYYYYEDLS